MGRKKSDKQATTILLPKRVHEAVKLCCEVSGHSMSQFIADATAQRVRNWTDPITGERVVQVAARAGLVEGSAGSLTSWSCQECGDASSCSNPSMHKKNGFWVNKNGEWWEEVYDDEEK